MALHYHWPRKERAATIDHMENSAKSNKPGSRLSPLEAEVIDLFVQFSQILGQRRSYAEIYGLLFVSPVPLNQDQLEEKLKISKGSTSMGLNHLAALNIVRIVKIPEQPRRTYYEAVAELRHLLGNFLQQHLATHLSDIPARLSRIEAAARALNGSAKKRADERIKTLQGWQRNGKIMLPVLLKMLGTS